MNKRKKENVLPAKWLYWLLFWPITLFVRLRNNVHLHNKKAVRSMEAPFVVICLRMPHGQSGLAFF